MTANISGFFPRYSNANKCFFLPEPDFDMIGERRVSNFITAIINAGSCPVAVLANLFIIIVIARRPSLQNPSNVLLAGLACSDLLVGLIVQPCYVTFRLMENVAKFVPCGFRVVYSESFWVCYGVSFMTLSAISIERYLALRLHLRYKGIITTRRVLFAIILIWIIDVLLTSLQWIAEGTTHVRRTQLVLFMVCLLVTLIAHLRMLTIMRRHHKQIQVQLSNASSLHVQSKLAVNVMYIVGFYLILNMPVMVVTLSTYVNGSHFNRNVFSWVETIAFCNSSLNPILCCWRNADIRKGVESLVCSRIRILASGHKTQNSIRSIAYNENGTIPENIKTFENQQS
ncbi:histamine H2 receptor [Nematostella vectensis]|uniref:histamine H2 receptor n=1 Tax=Nematostella vectensis TaxID=45351 RepID=UPI00207795C1|nr:histamine H2 receptor [Nematostella vectensis]